MNIEEAVKAYQTYACLDCGVCTGSCPISRVMPSFSPRIIVEKALLELGDELLQDRELWSCLTCSRCFERCPTKINFPEFMRVLREQATQRGIAPVLSHHGMLQSVMEFQAMGIRQKRTDWAREAGSIAETGDTFFFVGCMPYFDVIFRDMGVDSLTTSRNVIKILNAGGITPVVSNEECCCGHDMLWNGRYDMFKKLAEKNMALIRQSGARRVVFSCPEGYTTFKHQIPAAWDAWLTSTTAPGRSSRVFRTAASWRWSATARTPSAAGPAAGPTAPRAPSRYRWNVSRRPRPRAPTPW